MTWPAAQVASRAACAWAVMFAVIHVYWATGGSWGLPAGMALADHPLLFAVDLIAIPLCLCAAALALAVEHVRERRTSAWLTGLTFAAGAFFAVHSVPALVALGQVLIEGRASALAERDRLSLLIYEPYWFVGSLLFVLLGGTILRRRFIGGEGDRRPPVRGKS